MLAFLNFPTSVLGQFDVSLWDIVFKSTAALALAAIGCWLVRRQSAAVRHRIWVLGIAASLLVPGTASLLPQFPLAVLPGNHVEVRPLATGDIDQSSPQTISAPTGSGSIGVAGVQDPDHPSESPLARSAVQVTQVSDRRSNEQWFPTAGLVGVKQMLVLCWLIGTTISMSVFLVSLVQHRLKLRRLQKVDDAGWANAVATAANALGLPQAVPTLESDEVCVPAVVGVFRPRLVVPRDWRTWDRAQRHCILLHELAHIKRRDVATQLLGRLAFLAYWFNPLVWYAVRQLRVERELASDDCVLLSGQTASDYAGQLLRTLRACRSPKVAMGVAMAHSARLDQRVLAILDPQRRRDPVGSRLAIVLLGIVGAIGTLLGGLTLTTETASADPPTDLGSAEPMVTVQQMWKENYTIEYPGTLPVSVAFSANGEILLTGDTNGEVMALIFDGDDPKWRWKAQVGAAHAAPAFSADQKQVYVTYKDGVRILDAERGKEEAKIDVPASNPTAIGVFPDKSITDDVARTQIVFGNLRGYFVKTWVSGRLPDTLGTIETSTVADGEPPADESAVPLAVDPKGRSAIMTGPIDATGEVSGTKGQNILWAYVCGDYSEGGPGNRVMVGHTATVLSAAWAKEGSTAVTGDAAGRVIVWDATTMKETRRLELGGRVLSLAISDDGSHTAAWVINGNGCDLHLWETATAPSPMKPIHTEIGDFEGSATYASLAFAPEGKRLAGCAINKKWLTRLGELVGKVHVWDLANEPRAQLPPQHSYTKTLPKGSSSNFVVFGNHTLLTPVPDKGAVDLRNVATGEILARMRLGQFTIGGMKLSFDRKWLAMEQHQRVDPAFTSKPNMEFEVGVYQWPMLRQTTIPRCRQLLDIASGGKVIAVVRENGVEVWDVAATKVLQSAPFKHVRIDAAAFSPDGKLLAISDRNELVLWNWEEGRHERIELGRTVGSLTFSPDGMYVAEGPTPRENIQIREVATRQIVKTLDNGTKLSMNVPRMAYSQGGRVLIACDNITYAKGIAVEHRINLWDTATGAIAHKIALPAGLPYNLDISPNGRHLVTVLDDGESGMKLSVWRLDGKLPTMQPKHKNPPASAARE